MNLWNMLFGNIIERKKREYQSNIEAQVRRNTIGRVHEQVNRASAGMDQAVYKAQHGLVDRAKGRKKGGGPGQAPQAQGQGGGGAQGQNNQGRGGGQQGGRQGQGRGKAPMQRPAGPGRAQAPQGYQGQAVGRARGAAVAGYQQPAGGVANYSGAGGGQERTQAIDIRKLEVDQQRSVVGWLVALSGNHKGMDFRLFEGKNVIGTAANCELVVTDPYLSARHCTVRYDNGNFVIIDLDSRNGTYVNQKRISKEELIDNDVVRLGKTDFKFKSLY